MASANSNPFAGLEFMFAGIHPTRKSDVLVAVIHWVAIRNGHRCIGTDNEGKPSPNDTAPSELLPTGWNENPHDIYTLKYIEEGSDDKIVLLKLVRAADTLVVSAVNVARNLVSTKHFQIDNYISDDFQSYNTALKKTNELWKKINDGIFKELTESAPNPKERAANTSTRKESNPGTSHPRRDVPRAGPGFSLGYSDRFNTDEDPLVVGRGDLDPLGRAPGGMLMNPRGLPQYRIPSPMGRGGRGSLPRGSIPPGARFDPFGPPIPDVDPRRAPRFGNPDPDHLPPPGYDDMFG